MNQNPKVVAFKGLINRFFPVDFKIPNWHIADWKTEQDLIKSADIYFQINVKKRKTAGMPEYDFITNSGKPVLVCESNLFRKNSFDVHSPNCYWRLGWHHFLRAGDFNNKNSPPDRWNHIKKLQNLEVKDWRKKDGDILLCLQKPGDSTLNSLYEKWERYEDWIVDTVHLIRKYSDRPIKIRPHLKGMKKSMPWLLEMLQNKAGLNVRLSTTWRDRTVYEGGKGLQQDFDNAYAVVAYNSNSLVESTLAGIPSFPLSDESVVWDISNRIENLENPNLDIDRTQWLYNAGYMIWTAKEMNEGVAWDHLKGVYYNGNLGK